MIALLVALAFQVAPQEAAPQEAAPQEAAPQESGARWRVEPARVAIGQPCTWRLELDHAAQRRPLVAEVDLELDRSWLVVEGPRRVTRDAGQGRALTELRWTVLSLEPGERALPALEVFLDDGTGLAPNPAALVVEGELAQGEDGPRPMPGFHALQERTSPVRPRHLLWTLAALLAGAAGWVALTRSRRDRDGPEPSPLERFGRLDRDPGQDPEALRPLMVELSRLLRRAGEERLDAPRPAATDEEWIATLRAAGRHPARLVDDLEVLLADCAAVKFAGARPTRFAVQDTLERAETTLRALAQPEPLPAVGSGEAREARGEVAP